MINRSNSSVRIKTDSFPSYVLTHQNTTHYWAFQVLRGKWMPLVSFYNQEICVKLNLTSSLTFIHIYRYDSGREKIYVPYGFSFLHKIEGRPSQLHISRLVRSDHWGNIIFEIILFWVLFYCNILGSGLRSMVSVLQELIYFGLSILS